MFSRLLLLGDVSKRDKGHLGLLGGFMGTFEFANPIYPCIGGIILNRGIWNFAFIFGLAFTVIGVLILLSHARLSSQCTERTRGLIVKGDLQNNEYGLMLTFSANGEAYRLPFSYSSKMTEGLAVTVVYNPSKIGTYSLYILEDVSNAIKMAIICIGAGCVAMLIGYGVSIGLIPEVRLF